MKPGIIWVVIGVVVILIVLAAGLLPLPGQADNPTPYSQPSPQGASPQPAQPGGPPHDSAPPPPPPPQQSR